MTTDQLDAAMWRLMQRLDDRDWAQALDDFEAGPPAHTPQLPRCGCNACHYGAGACRGDRMLIPENVGDALASAPVIDRLRREAARYPQFCYTLVLDNSAMIAPEALGAYATEHRMNVFAELVSDLGRLGLRLRIEATP